jgi:hypothetical protein
VEEVHDAPVYDAPVYMVRSLFHGGKHGMRTSEEEYFLEVLCTDKKNVQDVQRSASFVRSAASELREMKFLGSLQTLAWQQHPL